MIKRPFHLDAGETKEFEIVLSAGTFRQTDSVVVQGGGPWEIARQDSLSTLALAGNDAKNLGSVLADDPLRAVQSLPGVSSNDDFEARFSIRGADYNRVGLYLDGILLHAPFHTVESRGSTGSVTAFNGKRLRAREIDDVLAEVESLPRNNLLRTKVVPFVDDNIGAIPSRSKKLFKELIPMKLLWGSQASITIAKDEELVALAAESGCHFMFIGLETMSNSALEAMGKHQNKIEDYAEALRLLRKYKIHVMGAFVFGFDTDSATVHDDTLAFAMENKVHVAQFADLTPYPGTQLYFQLKDEERLEPAYWMDPESCGRVVYKPKHTSGAVLRARTQALHREFYSYKSIFKRMMPPHKHWSYWLAFNLLYRQTIVANRSSDLDAPGAV